MKSIIAVGLACLALQVLGQTKTEKINKELSFELKSVQNTLMVANINGSIEVEAYSGSSIQVEVEKIITGKTEARLQKGLTEIQLGLIDRADTLILFVEGLCNKFGRSDENHGSRKSGWGYQWSNNCRDDQPEYDYKMNFKVKIPASVNLIVSTINDGDVVVNNLKARVIADNINGSITLTGLTEAAYVNTINGDVDIIYSTNPKGDCRFYTLNGDINALFKKGLSSKVAFKSFNGEFFTNLPELVSLPLEIEKTNSKKGIKYKINGNRYQTGSGGALLDFETFNGNVYLKEQ
jgi:DUF4097 and DUF4098 domain-containing protein YvlB